MTFNFTPEDLLLHCPGISEPTYLGKGSFKMVFKAKVISENIYEAIKVVAIPSSVNADEEEDLDKQKIDEDQEENLKRIYREIDILRKCNSKYMVKLGSIHPFEKSINGQKYLFYSEEYIDGVMLRRMINPNRSPSIDELRKLALCLMESIKGMTALNAIHRDIKPENIMMTSDSSRQFILLDLGIAFIVGGTALTQNQGAIPGTRYYLAPEMLQNSFRENLDYRSDLYTSGLVIYEHATGDNPFMRRDDSVYNTLHRIINNAPPPLTLRRPDLPKDFCETIDQLIKKSPALRPNNLTMLIRKLGDVK
ncbi:MAG: hypothetical protein RL095_261 [Verrucomicrobiota bacterium]|jgi:serine/threonine protein kinase